MMTAWVHGTASITLQADNVLYEQWIDSRQLRRMSRVMKFGVTAALVALKNAGIEKPDAIIAGTALGCLADTGGFLTQMVSEDEGILNPTPFMQSTHNTIASAVATMLQCNGYNCTYTQNEFSVEHALLDALMQLELNPGQNILVGGFDEITEDSRTIFERLGIKQLVEGAAWAVLSGVRSKSNISLSELEIKNDVNVGAKSLGFIEAVELLEKDSRDILINNQYLLRRHE
jgi:3-oxoacyl-[acyl-carrier-protein] synthase II